MGLTPARRRGSRLVRGCLALLACACATTAAAQTVTAPDLKAAFLFNFARFSEWPPDSLAPGARLILCVIGDMAVAESLERAVKGHDVAGHQVAVWRKVVNDPARACHMVYAGGVDKPQALRLIESVKGLPVFTVSDLATFTAMGGTAHLFAENGRMRFAVNVESAVRGRLSLRSQLLTLATIVKDDPNASAR